MNDKHASTVRDSNMAIHVDHVWKQYRLGLINFGYFRRDVQSWWARIRGREDPNRPVDAKDGQDPSAQKGDRFWALRDLTFSVERGEILGVIGSNGAGKSTLLKIMSRITRPTKGEIRLRGKVASLLEVGTGFHPELTGRENVFLNGAILGMTMPELHRKFDEIVSFSEVESFIDTPVKRYSSGMRVRLAFAVAAHLDPEIMVVDEVLAVGDLAFQKKCLGKMRNVSQQGRTVLFVSHNMSSITQLCDRAVLLDKGRQVTLGDAKDVVRQYQASSLEAASVAQKSAGFWQRPGGAASGEAVIEAVELIDPQSGERKQHSATGDPIAIRFHYRSSISRAAAAFKFVLRAEHGMELLDYSTRFDNVETPIEVGQGYVDCVFDYLALTAGTYHLDVGIRDRRGFIDECEGFCSFDVEPSFDLGTAAPYTSKICPVYLPHRWTFTPEPPKV